MPDHDPRDGAEAMRRGLIGRCPRCGRGRLFSGYLAIVDECETCGEPLERYRAADGPAFITITIVGLLLIPVLGFSFVALRPDPLTLSLIVAGSLTVLTLVILRVVKGGFVGHLWAQEEVDRGA